MNRCRIGFDIGGTFTDVVLFDEDTGEHQSAKVSSTPSDPSIGAIEEYELIPDSGGPGKYRGGLGIKRKYKVHGHTCVLTVNTDWIKQKPDGLMGGGRGRNTKIVFIGSNISNATDDHHEKPTNTA